MSIIIADVLMVAHLAWATFMVVGLPLGLLTRSPTVRWLPFFGMMVTGTFAALGTYCPLTIWEEGLRRVVQPDFSYGGSFIARHLGPILYPDISPAILNRASVFWGLLTLILILIWRPGAPSLRKGKGDY